jgi:LEA14-like dessication related protein
LEINKFKNFEIVEFKDNSLTLKANIVVNNPNPVRMKISDADFELKINEKVIGHLLQMDKLVLPARSQNEYPVTAKFQLTNLQNGLFSLIQIVNRKDSKISVSGSVIGSSFLYRKKFDFNDIKIYE